MVSGLAPIERSNFYNSHLMNEKLFTEAVADPKKLTALSLAELREVKAEYPYFHTAYLLWAKKAAMEEATDFREILGEAASFTADRSILSDFIKDDLNLRIPYSSSSFVEKFPKGPILDVEEPVWKAGIAGEDDNQKSKSHILPLSEQAQPENEVSSENNLKSLTEEIQSEAQQTIRTNVDQDLNELRMEEEVKRSQKLAELQSQKDALRELKLKIQQYSASREQKKKKEEEVKRSLTDEADLDRSVTQLIKKYGNKDGKKKAKKEEEPLPNLKDSPLFSSQNENIKQIEEYLHNYDIPDQDNAIPSSAEFDSEEINQVSETMARVYIDQGKYEKAISVYKQLKLKYPEKFVYFAQQIRVLTEKL